MELKMRKVIVEMIDYCKSINEYLILKNINLEIFDKEIVGIIGANASGKSMLLKAISGLIEPTHGSVMVFGKRIGHKGVTANNTGVLIEKPSFLRNKNGFVQLKYLAQINKSRTFLKDAQIALEYVGLNKDDKRNVSKYSLGMQQKLGIAIAVLGSPKLILLDEPTSNLDKLSIEKIHKLLLKLNYEGATIVIASHQDNDIENLCSKVIKIENGEIIDILRKEKKHDKFDKS